MDSLLVMDHKRKRAALDNLEIWMIRRLGETLEQFNRRLAASKTLVTGNGCVRDKVLELKVLEDKITNNPGISWRFNGSVFLGIYWRPYNIDMLNRVYNNLIMTEGGGGLDLVSGDIQSTKT